MFCSPETNFAELGCGAKHSHNSIDFSISGYSRAHPTPTPTSTSSRSICVRMVEQGVVTSVRKREASGEMQNPWSSRENRAQRGWPRGFCLLLIPHFLLCLLSVVMKMKATGSSKMSVDFYKRCMALWPQIVLKIPKRLPRSACCHLQMSALLCSLNIPGLNPA